MSAKQKRNFFKHYKKIFSNEFKGYNGGRFLRDILAGLTVAAVALPLALAFGAASVGPEHTAIGIAAGLITAIVAGIVTGMLGGGSFQISGPTGAMTVVLGSVVSGTYGLQGMFLACFMAGIILLVAGLLRFGKVIQFIPRPVVTGFTSGIAIVIALGQVGNFFGVPLSGESTIDKVAYFFTDQLSHIDLTTVICSLAVVFIMIIYPKKLASYVPGSLVAIILITAVVKIFGIDVGLIGEIPASLVNEVTFDITAVTPAMLTSLIGPAFTIAALGMVESLLCGTCAANMKKEKFDSNVELIAQGAGNMIIPFLGGVPSTAAIARTSVAVKSGGQTRLTGLFQSIFLIVCMFLLSGVIGMVPYAALAGVLMVTAWRMNEWETIKYYFKNKLWDAIAMFLITMIATVFLDLTYAIIIGVIVSFLLMVVKLSRMKVDVSELEDIDRNGVRTFIIYCSGAMFFASEKELRSAVEKVGDEFKNIIIDMSGIFYLDVSAVSQLSETVKNIREQGREVYFCGVREEIMKVFRKCKLDADIGEENFYSSVDRFIVAEEVHT